MVKWMFGLILVVFSASCLADDPIEVNLILGSYHWDKGSSASGAKRRNDVFGINGNYKGVDLTVFRNSYKIYSFAAGYKIPFRLSDYCSLGVTLGLVSGYTKNKHGLFANPNQNSGSKLVLPFALPSVSVNVGKYLSTVSLFPSGAVFSVGYAF